MKYGLLVYSYGVNSVKVKNKYYINIGNDMQTLAIESLYRKMGIDESQIIKIKYNELRTYRGEYVILPMNMFGSKDEIFPLSSYIIPFFIGFNYTSSKCVENREYLKKYEPIGCRDEYTFNLMRESGIEAYFSGCLSITLPKRVEEPVHSKIFIVDAPASLEKFIPSVLRTDIEYITHEIETNEVVDNIETINTVYKYARHMLSRYEKEATLVITSRLHCAAPCIALGIPVILVKENVDINLSWIDKYLKIYSVNEFSEINWQPKVIDLEEIKERLYQIFKEGILKIHMEKRKIYELSIVYETRERSNYNNLLAEKLDLNMVKFRKTNLRYLIWGAGAGGTLAYQLIREKYPEFTLVGVIDTYEKGHFFNMKIEHPDKINMYQYDYIFICTYSGREEAMKKMETLQMEDGKSYMFLISRVTNKMNKVHDDFVKNLDEFLQKAKSYEDEHE